MKRKVIEFVEPLDYSGNDKLHGKLIFDEQRDLEKFTLNYTTILEENSQKTQREVIRYDCSHGHLHLHRFDRRPSTIERVNKPIEIAPVEALTLEIKTNWKTWKKNFMRNRYGATI